MVVKIFKLLLQVLHEKFAV